MAHDVLWFSNSAHVRSGYGRNTREITKRMKQAGYDVAVIGMQTWGVGMVVEGIMHYPLMLDIFGSDVVPHYLKTLKPRMLILHGDIWAFGWLPQAAKDAGVPLWAYSPVDHVPVPQPVVQLFEQCEGVIAFCEWARRQLVEDGYPEDRIYVIPHGVDTKTFRPRSKRQARKTLSLPEDGFIFGFVGHNKGPRKNPGAALYAFKLFLDDNPDARDAYFYFFTDPVGVEGGHNIALLAARLGLQDRVYTVTRETFYLADDNVLVNVYNALDAHVLLSMAEGFGLTVLEAAACGIPNIVTDAMSLPEVAGDGGLLVRVASVDPTPLGSFYVIPDVYDAADKMAKLYNDDSLRRKLGEAARRHAQSFEWDKVFRERWLPFLREQLEGRREREAELLEEIKRLREEIEKLKAERAPKRRRRKGGGE